MLSFICAAQHVHVYKTYRDKMCNSFLVSKITIWPIANFVAFFSMFPFLCPENISLHY